VRLVIDNHIPVADAQKDVDGTLHDRRRLGGRKPHRKRQFTPELPRLRPHDPLAYWGTQETGNRLEVDEARLLIGEESPIHQKIALPKKRRGVDATSEVALGEKRVRGDPALPRISPVR